MSCFTALRQIRSGRQSLPQSAIKRLVWSLVLSILDNGNASLTSIIAYLLLHLQSVLNVAGRIIAGLLHSAHISTTLPTFIDYRLLNTLSLNYRFRCYACFRARLLTTFLLTFSEFQMCRLVFSQWSHLLAIVTCHIR